MANMAIGILDQIGPNAETGFGLSIGGTTKRTRRRKPRRFLSKAVRERNTEVGRPWWQPSRSRKMSSRTRAAALAEAIRDELVEADQPEPIQPIGYEDNATLAFEVRLKQELVVEEEMIVAVGLAYANAACSEFALIECGGYDDIVADLEEDYELEGAAELLLAVEEPLLRQLAAA